MSFEETDQPAEFVEGYKLFKVYTSRPGQVFPLYVDAHQPIPMRIWLAASVGPSAGSGKVKSRLGSLAMRPGWHAGDLPIALHIGDKEKASDSFPSWRSEDHVWAKVLLPADVDWQIEAESRARTGKSGHLVRSTAHITDQVPFGGHYRYKTNPNMVGEWLIAGSMQIIHLLSDQAVGEINAHAGVEDLPRKNPFDMGKYGFGPSDFEEPVCRAIMKL